MNQLKPPEELSLQGNVQANWKRFKQKFEFFLVASGSESKADRLKTSLFLHVVGDEAVELYNTFEFDNSGDEMKLTCVLEKFEEYCNPKRNLTYERHLFFNHTQTTETVDQYATELKRKAKSCEFGDLSDDLIKDRIISGIQNMSVKDRLLRVEDLTLTKALDICRASELTSTRLKDMTEEKSLNVISKMPYKSGKNTRHSKMYRQFPSNEGRYGETQHQNKSCYKCGKLHAWRKCPAFGKNCLKCHARNHFARMCTNRPRGKPGAEAGSRVHVLQKEEDGDQFFIGSLRKDNCTKVSNWSEPIEINNTVLWFHIDTGAQVNVLPKAVFERIKRNEVLQKTSMKIVGYGNSEVRVLGIAKLKAKIKSVYAKIEFVVVDIDSDPILGQQDSVKYKLVARVATCKEKTTEDIDILKKYDDVFQGTGCLPKPYKMQLRSDAVPVIHPIRQIPLKIQAELKIELDKMISEGIIVKIDGPTEWCHNIVIVEKPDGKLRICLDPKDLNEVLLREHYRIPNLEDIVGKLKGAKYFSVLDANCGFWNVPLHEESTDICTFGTPFGRYKFLRMPFGISSAPEVFQRYMDEITENLEGTFAYFDDCLIWGSSIEEHDDRLEKVLQKSRQVNLKLNKSKRQIRQTEIAFLGHVLTADGIKADPSKTEAIRVMEEPTNKKELERFLGMVTYLTKFVPNMSSHTQCLRELLKQDVHWDWNSNHSKEFEDLIVLLSNPPVLTYFDDQKDITLSVDASSKGLGAVLLQENKPIAYASRSLTQAEQNYAPIEKETLAIVFGTEKYHQFVYGRKVIIESDHKPLEAIFKKSLIQTPPRLQRFRLRLQKYDINVKYRPGKEMVLADTLSRANIKAEHKPAGNEIKESDLTAQVHLLVRTLPISPEKYKEFQKATNADPVLQELKKVVLNGWPETKKQVPESLGKFWTYREEIHTAQDILFKANRIIVPESLKENMLQRIHGAHQGMVKCKNNARECLFWPGINSDIENVVNKCKMCQTFQRKNIKEPLVQHSIPTKPWEKVVVDLFEITRNDIPKS